VTPNISVFFEYSVGFIALAQIFSGAKRGQFGGIDKAQSGGQTLLVSGLSAANGCASRIPLPDELRVTAQRTATSPTSPFSMCYVARSCLKLRTDGCDADPRVSAAIDLKAMSHARGFLILIKALLVMLSSILQHEGERFYRH
jgi:hypothetical protein